MKVFLVNIHLSTLLFRGLVKMYHAGVHTKGHLTYLAHLLRTGILLSRTTESAPLSSGHGFQVMLPFVTQS